MRACLPRALLASFKRIIIIITAYRYYSGEKIPDAVIKQISRWHLTEQRLQHG